MNPAQHFPLKKKIIFPIIYINCTNNFIIKSNSRKLQGNVYMYLSTFSSKCFVLLATVRIHEIRKSYHWKLDYHKPSSWLLCECYEGNRFLLKEDK